MANTVTINVSLDENGNPPVELTDSSGKSDRDQKVDNGDTIKWMKKDNNDSFNIIELTPTGAGEAFSTPLLGGNGQWLTSVFDSGNSPAGTPFAYTLSVRTTSGIPKVYNTTAQTHERDEDRPVIRN